MNSNCLDLAVRKNRRVILCFFADRISLGFLFIQKLFVGLTSRKVGIWDENLCLYKNILVILRQVL